MRPGPSRRSRIFWGFLLPLFELSDMMPITTKHRLRPWGAPQIGRCCPSVGDVCAPAMDQVSSRLNADSESGRSLLRATGRSAANGAGRSARRSRGCVRSRTASATRSTRSRKSCALPSAFGQPVSPLRPAVFHRFADHVGRIRRFVDISRRDCLFGPWSSPNSETVWLCCNRLAVLRTCPGPAVASVAADRFYRASNTL
jgi:hypothetical protein